MILNHLWGLYAHPIEEWQTIDNLDENISQSVVHVAIVALIPSIMTYVCFALIGWQFAVAETIFLSHKTALIASSIVYFFLILGVFALAYFIHWMARNFEAKSTYTHTLELATYTTTPIFLSAISLLFPKLWCIAVICFSSLLYSIYLFYVGVPILMHIPNRRGILFTTSVVIMGFALSFVLIGSKIILWTNNTIGPTFSVGVN